jgi:alkylation response protein AidB-like acyl-CoA dehydrogenase
MRCLASSPKRLAPLGSPPLRTRRDSVPRRQFKEEPRAWSQIAVVRAGRRSGGREFRAERGAARLPGEAAWDEGSIFPVDTLRRAAALGFGGIKVREDLGGAALGHLDSTIIIEELAQGCT